MADLQQVVGQVQKDETPVAVQIKQRNGLPYLAADGSPATISVLGSESPTYRQKRSEVYRALSEEKDETDAAQLRIAVAAVAVTGWHGWEDAGRPLPCTPENVKALLSVEHILSQVENGVTRRADFFGAGSAG